MPWYPEEPLTSPSATDDFLDFLLNDEAWTPDSESDTDSEFESEAETDLEFCELQSEEGSMENRPDISDGAYSTTILHLIPGGFPKSESSVRSSLEDSDSSDTGISTPSLAKVEALSLYLSDSEIPDHFYQRRSRPYSYGKKHSLRFSRPKLVRVWRKIGQTLKTGVKIYVLILLLSVAGQIVAEYASGALSFLGTISAGGQKHALVFEILNAFRPRQVVCTGLFPFNQVCYYESPISRLLGSLDNIMEHWDDFVIRSYLLVVAPGMQFITYPSRVIYQYNDYRWPFFTRHYGSPWSFENNPYRNPYYDYDCFFF